MKTIDQYIVEWGQKEYDRLTRLPGGEPWPISEKGVPLCDRCLMESTRYACPHPDSVVFFCDSCDEHAPLKWARGIEKEKKNERTTEAKA